MAQKRLYEACKIYRNMELNIMEPGYAADLAKIWARARDDEWYRNWVLEATGYDRKETGCRRKKKKLRYRRRKSYII